jgi:hypothetical protein
MDFPPRKVCGYCKAELTCVLGYEETEGHFVCNACKRFWRSDGLYVVELETINPEGQLNCPRCKVSLKKYANISGVRWAHRCENCKKCYAAVETGAIFEFEGTAATVRVVGMNITPSPN